MNWCTDQDFLWHKNRLYKKRISIFDKREEAKVAISIFSIIDFFLDKNSIFFLSLNFDF